MEEIELSVMIHTPGTEKAMKSLLDEFAARHAIRVNLTCLDWVTARAELNKAALYHHGPDISEVGSTWVPDLISMDVISPLLPHEIGETGKGNDFVPATWSTAQMPEDTIPKALPWHAETYIIHYRKDLLEKAGLNPAKAFSSHAAIEATAAKLAKTGIPVPLELTLQTDRYGTLHALASWVWANKGEFLSADSKRLLLDQPQALQALRAYFGLLQYASPEGRQAMLEKTDTPLFHQGLSAITFGTIRLASPEWVEMAEPEEKAHKRIKENWGWAPLPQPCFVGGSNLVIWKHSRKKDSAIKLLNFLTEAQTLKLSSAAMATLPPRISALQSQTYAEDPMLKVMSQAIQSGRTYPPLKLWGLVEDKIVAGLLNIGAQVLESPPADAQKIIEREVANICHRVSLILMQ
jgi:multiple sugar transport system substrate-binding protein